MSGCQKLAQREGRTEGARRGFRAVKLLGLILSWWIHVIKWGRWYRSGGRHLWKTSVPSAQFCCESQSAPKKLSLWKKVYDPKASNCSKHTNTLQPCLKSRRKQPEGLPLKSRSGLYYRTKKKPKQNRLFKQQYWDSWQIWNIHGWLKYSIKITSSESDNYTVAT